MAKNIMLTRDEAELLVDLLEDNYCNGNFQPVGVGADLSTEIREKFGMNEQPPLKRNVIDKDYI